VSTRDKLLQIFDGKPGLVLSGQILARNLGISRMAVWKQIQSMKNVGLPIESTGRQGYRLQAPFDSSLVRFSAPHGITPHYFLNTPSTQTLAKAGAAAGLPEGHLWIAETQSKGRGRVVRLWESGYGGLWFSLLLRPKVSASRVPPLALIAGMALRDAVETISGVKAKLKWPNDVVVGTGDGKFKKLAGILTEMSGQTDRTEWVSIGVGLNVNNTVSKELSGRAVSLYGLTGKASPRARFLERFIHHLYGNYAGYQKEGFEPYRRAYWSSYFAPDQPVHLKTAEGALLGRARGVDGFGRIMIESRRKIRPISEGEIIL
jgi:BirA family biotin operon repressor/biotin-[acetyl-CoA-carboxylase] ligase